jgi:hypothetical protein
MCDRARDCPGPALTGGDEVRTVEMPENRYAANKNEDDRPIKESLSTQDN